tara:strand:- start:43 stop:837 length:795 start_codon:yes stop_codon:yes gene_type:complete
MQDSPSLIDPHRPWILDRRDDPSTMNWIQTLFNPMGQSSKLHFSRAWTFMFMGRLLLYLVPTFVVAILGIAGLETARFSKPVSFGPVPVPAMLVPFVLFALLTEYTSFVAHVRRLAEAGRSTLLAGIVLLPLILGMLAFAGGAAMGNAQYEAEVARIALEKEIAADPVKAAAAKADAEAKAKETPKAQNPQQRSGPPEAPKTARETAISTGMGMAVPIWLLASFGAMLWTLLYVARMPNGGVGEFSTGSHIPENEALRRPYETV